MSKGFRLQCYHCSSFDCTVDIEYPSENLVLCCNNCSQEQHELGIILEEPLPPDGFYYTQSERSSTTPIVQVMGNAIYCFNETGPVTLDVLHRRGWKIIGRVPDMEAREHHSSVSNRDR